MVRRLVAVLVVAVSVLGVLSPTEARADGLWFLPSSWLTAHVGQVAAVVGALNGGAVSVGQGDSRLIGDSPEYTNQHGIWEYHVKDSGAVDGAGWPVLLWEKFSQNCLWGSDPNTPNTYCSNVNRPTDGDTYDKSAWLMCANGQSVLTTYSLTYLTTASRTTCGVAGPSGVAKIFIAKGVKSTLGYFWPDMTFSLGGAVTFTTTVTCRNVLTRADADVTEVGQGEAPTPLCPDGSVPIRVRVWEGSELVQDVSLGDGSLDEYWSYIRDPYQWTWGGDDKDCWITNNDDPTMVIVLAVGVCQEAGEGGVVGPGDDPTPEDCNVFCQLVKSGVDGIKRVLIGIAGGVSKIVTGVKDTIKAVKDSATKIVDGVVSGVGSAIDRVIEAIKDLQKAMEDGFSGIGDGGDDGGGGCEGADCPGGPGGIGHGGMHPGDIAGKFAPWTDALSGLIGVFNRPDPGCLGPVVRADFQLGQLGTEPFVAYPFAACEEPMRTAAALTKAGLTLLFIVGGILGVVRILGSSFGVGAIGGGGAAEGDS